METEIEGYPTIRFFPGSDKSHFGSKLFEGERNYDAIISFIQEHVTKPWSGFEEKKDDL